MVGVDGGGIGCFIFGLLGVLIVLELGYFLYWFEEVFVMFKKFILKKWIEVDIMEFFM